MSPDAPFRCIAEGRDGAWWAICIDLDISVQGSSLAEVRESLRTAISMYLERVAELPEGERQSLLHRRAPWHVRAKFYVYGFLGRLLGVDGKHRQFLLPAHA